jgi:hypothetical protein
MRSLFVRPPGKRPAARRRPLVVWPGLLALLLCSLLTLLTPALTFAQSGPGGPGPGHLTSAQFHALEQALKKKIHVKHTGKALKPAVKSGTPLRPQNISGPAYNNIGISDSTTRTSANFDTAFRSYQAQALQDAGLYPGINVTSQNVTFIWPSVPTGQADNWQAAGQVISLSSLPGASTLGFLGASTNGSASGTATITYTDNSTATFTLGLTDWWNGTAQFSNNVQVAHLTTIDTKHGTKTGNFYLYSATTPIDTSKHLKSVTLPTTVSPGQLHIFAIGVGMPVFMNKGVSDDSNPSAANYDGQGYSYSAQALAGADLVPNQQFDFDGIAYSWPDEASGSDENWIANGQNIILPVTPVPNATTLGFLGSATNGGSSGTATMTFTDNSTQTFTLGFTDWGQSTLQFGNQLAATMSYRNSSSGKQTGTFDLFATEVPIPAGKTLQSVTLPTSVTGGQLHVFAVGTRGVLNNLGTSNDSQPGEGAYDSAEHSWSIQQLEAAGIKQGQPFSFNGVPFTWPASYGTLADNYVAAGQTIPVTPVANATTLAFIGSGTNGSPTGTATITYTDNSTSTFTLGLSDWWNNNAQYGNLIVTSVSSLNQPGGAYGRTVYLYYAETSLLAGKTIQSVTLPSTVSTGQMHIFAIGTRSTYNNTGISDNSNPGGANFDGNWTSYSEEDFTDPTIAGWNPGDTLTYEGINYVWPGVPAGQADNYQAAGQTIPVSAPAGATTVGFVGAASYGGTTGSSGTATLHYTDGSTSTFTLCFADWWKAIPCAGNHLFAALPHYNNPQGTFASQVYLFETETPLNSSKQLQSVTLPSSVSQGQLHVFMIGTRTGENYPNNVGTSDDSDTQFANLDGNGASYSIEALEATGVYEGQSFTFNGVTFNWPASYSVIPDNYQAAGQVIPSSQIAGPLTGATTLAFLGAATDGGSTGSSGTATITYTDGSTQTFTLGFTDWAKNSLLFSNQIAATSTYYNNASGQQSGDRYVFYVDVTLQAGKTIQSVTLPSSVTSGTALHVFALGTK